MQKDVSDRKEGYIRNRRIHLTPSHFLISGLAGSARRVLGNKISQERSREVISKLRDK